jgi:hypothetical protein
MTGVGSKPNIAKKLLEHRLHWIICSGLDSTCPQTLILCYSHRVLWVQVAVSRGRGFRPIGVVSIWGQDRSIGVVVCNSGVV